MKPDLVAGPRPIHPLWMRPDVEQALQDPKRNLSPALQQLHDSQTSESRLRVMRSWLLVIAAIDLAMLWGAVLSGPAAFRLGIMLCLGFTLPLACAVFIALPHLAERARPAILAIYNVTLITTICIQSHFATPDLADHYIMAAGLLIGASNLLVPVAMRPAIWFTAGATALFAGLTLAPVGPYQPKSLDLLGLLGVIGVATLRARWRIQHGERQTFLFRLQDALNTQDVIFANRILMDLSNTDPLTRVANRRCFDERLNTWWQQHAASDVPIGLLMIDVDGFKSFNDQYGHPAGDQCLRDVARAMGLGLRDVQATLARYGGEEFAVLLPGLNLDGVQLVGERLRQAVERLGIPHEGRTDGPACVTISVGAVSSPGGAPAGPAPASAPQASAPNTSAPNTSAPNTSAHRAYTADTLIKNADLALYQAKRLGRNRLCAAADVPDQAASARLPPLAYSVAALSRSASLADDLRTALLAEDLHVQYQPICTAQTGAIVGFEALMRWAHPLRGDVPPSVFIPAAEESGLIVALGKWVLRKACAEAASWPAAHAVAVNISPVQFSDPRIVSAISTILTETGLAPNRLLLEITEGLQLYVSEGLRETLMGLRQLGIGIALDDFGTGYANLSRLRELPFDVIKLDRSFLDQAPSGADPLDMLTPLVGFARAFGSKVVMEGVETAEQLSMARTLGCEWTQGFYLSEPVSPEAIDALIRTNQLPATPATAEAFA